jgi:hypothetical protein
MTLHKATRRSSWAKIWAQLSYLWVEVFRLVFLSSISTISELKYAVSFSNQKEERKKSILLDFRSALWSGVSQDGGGTYR